MAADPLPSCAALQLEALYSLLDDDGSGSLTVHEMIDLFVRPAPPPPSSAYGAPRHDVAAEMSAADT